MKRVRHRISSVAGFTLLELLIVLSILGVVTTVGTTTFITVTSSWNERRAIAELDAQAQQVLESIRVDLAATLSQELSGYPLVGVAGDVEDDRTFPPAILPDDRLAIPVRTIDGRRAMEVPAVVGYRVQRAAGVSTLVRTVGPLDKGFPNGAPEDLIPRASVLGFRVEYLGGGPDSVWTTSWTRVDLPRAVRVSLSLEDAYTGGHQVARKLVMPIRVH